MTFPIKIPKGLKPIITQPYGNTSNNEWYRNNGINIPMHNGTDIVLSGDPISTYGAPLITPSKDWKIVKTIFDSPLSTKGNGITIESQPFEENGITKVLQVVYWHCSEVERDRPYEKLPAHTVVAYVGNSGLVSPAPSTVCPFCGSHLHLMLFEFHLVNGRYVLQNADNGLNGAIDPMTRFDINDIIYSEDDVTKDAPPFQWSFDKLGLTEVWQKIIYILKTVKIK